MSYEVLIYLASIYMVTIGPISGGKILSGDPLNRPLNPAALTLLTGLGSLTWVVALIVGMWQFSWWVPTAAFTLSIFAVGSADRILASKKSPQLSLLASLAGISLACATLFS